MNLPIRVGVRAAIVRDGHILLVECQDGDTPGLHYNLPGGGVEPGEPLYDALHREAHEETCTRIEIRRLLMVYEYHADSYVHKYGRGHHLGLIFQCDLLDGEEPRMPLAPDEFQIAVRWVPLEQISQSPDFPQVRLIPEIGFKLVAALRQFHAWDAFTNEV